MPDLTELRRLLDEGTPRPWMSDRGGEWHSRVISTSKRVYSDVADTGNRADADLIAAAVTALPDLLDAAEALERVRALHYEVVVYELDSNGYWVYVDGERKVLARLCAECSSVDLIDAIEDGEYRQGWDYGRAVDWPCPTIRAIDGEPQP